MKKLNRILWSLLILTTASFAQDVPAFDIKLKATLHATCLKECNNSGACIDACNQKYGSPTNPVAPTTPATSISAPPPKTNDHNYCLKKCGCVGNKCILKKKVNCYNQCRK